jgi:hypothetical protein
MSVLDEIKKLEQQKQQLLKKAKADAITRAEAAIKDLNELGFAFQLVEAGTSTGGGSKPKRPRRTGIRQQLLKLIKSKPKGMARRDLLNALDAHDKSGQQSVSNALAALKKQNAITASGGVYKAV